MRWKKWHISTTTSEETENDRYDTDHSLISTVNDFSNSDAYVARPLDTAVSHYLTQRESENRYDGSFYCVIGILVALEKVAKVNPNTFCTAQSLVSTRESKD